MAAFTAAASPPTGASAALAEPQHEQGWTDFLAAQGVHPDLIEHMRKERIINASRLANYIEVRADVKTLLVDAVEATKGSRSQLTVLVGLWRDSENAEDEKSKNARQAA